MKEKGLLRLMACVVTLGMTVLGGVAAGAAPDKVTISKEGQACIDCHKAQSPAFVKEWEQSTHAKKSVDCYTCHKADKSDPDAMEHNGFTIAILVTPKDCSQCHPIIWAQRLTSLLPTTWA